MSQSYRNIYMFILLLLLYPPRTIAWNILFLSVDSERVGRRQVLSTGSKGLDTWSQRNIAEATWDGPAKLFRVSPQRKAVMLSSPSPSPLELGRQALGRIFWPLMCGQCTCRWGLSVRPGLTSAQKQPNPDSSEYGFITKIKMWWVFFQ